MEQEVDFRLHFQRDEKIYHGGEGMSVGRRGGGRGRLADDRGNRENGHRKWVRP